MKTFISDIQILSKIYHYKNSGTTPNKYMHSDEKDKKEKQKFKTTENKRGEEEI